MARLGFGGAIALGATLLGLALSGMAGLDARIARADHQQRVTPAPSVRTVPVRCSPGRELQRSSRRI